MAMAVMNTVSAGGFSGVSFHLRRCPQGVASALCKKTPIFGSRRSKLDHLTVRCSASSSGGPGRAAMPELYNGKSRAKQAPFVALRHGSCVTVYTYPSVFCWAGGSIFFLPRCNTYAWAEEIKERTRRIQLSGWTRMNNSTGSVVVATCQVRKVFVDRWIIVAVKYRQKNAKDVQTFKVRTQAVRFLIWCTFVDVIRTKLSSY